MWKITLDDGTILDNLKLDGNNFVSEAELDADFFAGKLGHVVIECDDENVEDFGLRGTHEHMRLAACKKYSDGWNFILEEIPAAEIEKAKLEGNIEYIAMMTGVEL